MDETWSVTNVVAEPDRLLAVTDDPRHRAMIEDFRRHALLEIAGRWREILESSMLVDDPVYRINEGGRSLVLRGKGQVADFYREMAEGGLTVFGPISENIAVADWGLAIESHFLHHLPGRALLAQGEDVDPDGCYRLTHYMASFWPYDENGRLVGEHIYEDVGSREITPVERAQFVTPAMARDAVDAVLLAPLP